MEHPSWRLAMLCVCCGGCECSVHEALRVPEKEERSFPPRGEESCYSIALIVSEHRGLYRTRRGWRRKVCVCSAVIASVMCVMYNCYVYTHTREKGSARVRGCAKKSSLTSPRSEDSLLCTFCEMMVMALGWVSVFLSFLLFVIVILCSHG